MVCLQVCTYKFIAPQEAKKRKKEADRKRDYRERIKNNPAKHEQQREYNGKKMQRV